MNQIYNTPTKKIKIVWTPILTAKQAYNYKGTDRKKKQENKRWLETHHSPEPET